MGAYQEVMHYLLDQPWDIFFITQQTSLEIPLMITLWVKQVKWVLYNQLKGGFRRVKEVGEWNGTGVVR
jgi:hypothetical protein